jgi:replicative DNA helicase
MNHPSLRADLERHILGACILEANTFAKVADMLAPKNFLAPSVDRGVYIDHQAVFQAFQKLYPAQPISLLTMRKVLDTVPATELAKLSGGVYWAGDIRFYAAVLLEYNFREAFIELLHPVYESNYQNISTITRVAISEILDEAIDYDNDVFEVITNACKYLRNIGADDNVLKMVDQFNNQIDVRIYQIKKQSSIDTLINNVTALNNIPHDTKTRMAVSHLTDILKTVLGVGKVEPQLANKIFELKV